MTTIRDALGFMLECKGWQVRAYASARDFLTQDSPSIPGCLLLDIRMPDMSGVQLQTLMKEQRIQLPIIFITGHADVETAVATLKAGALDFLQKPVNTIALIEAIEPAVRISLGAFLRPVVSRKSHRSTSGNESARKGNHSVAASWRFKQRNR